MQTTLTLEQLYSRGAQFLADGGLETAMIFHEGFDLPEFAAFTLLDTAEGRAALSRYFKSFIHSAGETGMSFLMDTPTWRANPDWGEKLGLTPVQIAEVNANAVAFVRELRSRYGAPDRTILINGAIGPQGDGYNPDEFLTADEAEAYHALQIAAFAKAGVDSVAAVTMCYPQEAIGIARAAQCYGLDCIISFTVETDGKLVSGYSLRDAIEMVDEQTGNAPVFYMINCAHPDHFVDALRRRESWLARIGGVRANASRMSHAELDNAEELDDGDPVELAQNYRELTRLLPNLRIFGGCCGTDHRHVTAIGHACATRQAA